MSDFKYLKKPGSGEYVEKASRFIADCFTCETEQEALDFITLVKKKYYDAKHHCFAYIIGEKDEFKRFSDDGEPSRTAGFPIMQVIEGEGLHNICVVVTRYFGGTLLGTGGLVRAYTQATKEALANSETGIKRDLVFLTLIADYKDSSKLSSYAQLNDIETVSASYAQDVTFVFALLPDDVDSFITTATNLTSGRVRITEQVRKYT